MNNAGRGIAGILKESDFLDPLKESIISAYKVEKASKAGKANSEKYQKLRDLALEVYVESCGSLFDNIPNGPNLLEDKTTAASLLKSLRPTYRTFFKDFLDASEQLAWKEFEVNFLKRLKTSELSDSTLYGWWKGFNADLRHVLANAPWLSK